MKDYRVPLNIIRELSDGEFHSGEQLGDSLGMSRAAINQHIHTLKRWGLDIYTVTGKGYCLSAPFSYWRLGKSVRLYRGRGRSLLCR